MNTAKHENRGRAEGGAGMRFGIGIPPAGGAASGPDGMRFVPRAQALGFALVWSGDHLVLSIGGTTPSPYTTDGSLARPSPEGSLEPFTLLADAGRGGRCMA
jgi:alkanesulfonate monooxygenase SsuD/methylene tetrahydromethanopterin reductase-like flavin-dependent oxidoreductase (luciferase family)